MTRQIGSVSNCMASAWGFDRRQMIYRTFNRMFFQQQTDLELGAKPTRPPQHLGNFSSPPVALLAQQQTRPRGAIMYESPRL